MLQNHQIEVDASLQEIQKAAYTDVKIVALLEQMVMGLAVLADEVADLNQTLTKLRK